MSLIRWQDSFSTGLSCIDSDHQVLVSLLNQLSEAREEGQAREVIGSVLNVLVEYTLSHFRREERVMEACDYPGLAEHKDQHRQLALKVRQMRQVYDGGHYTAVDELLTFLKNWLVDHIIGEDTQIAPWVSAAGLGPNDLSEILSQPLGVDDEGRTGSVRA